jgi:hypothetical protein
MPKFASLLFITVTVAATLSAQSPAGAWDGVVRTTTSAPTRILLTLDSTGSGWAGTLQAPGQDSTIFRLDSVARLGDSVAIRLPADAGGTLLQGKLSADGNHFEGVAGTQGGATFVAARSGTADASALVAEALRFETSRRLANAMVDTVADTPTADPDSARLVTSDVPRFWRALDMQPPEGLAAHLQQHYLEGGSVGLHDFIQGRILSAEDLALYIRSHRARYDSVRTRDLDMTRAEPGIRSAFRKLKALYPDAVFPSVYFVVGRFNSGGTASIHGLLIGVEMQRSVEQVPAIVAHELIHYQQHYENRTLLAHAFLEGSADFLGEMISGSQINNAAHQYGMAHEQQLWQEFQPHFEDRDYFPWMYGRPDDGRPADLGYFIGYRIAQAYYNRAPDKAKAIRDIISGGGGDVRRLLVESGYGP